MKDFEQKYTHTNKKNEESRSHYKVKPSDNFIKRLAENAEAFEDAARIIQSALRGLREREIYVNPEGDYSRDFIRILNDQRNIKKTLNQEKLKRLKQALQEGNWQDPLFSQTDLPFMATSLFGSGEITRTQFITLVEYAHTIQELQFEAVHPIFEKTEGEIVLTKKSQELLLWSLSNKKSGFFVKTDNENSLEKAFELLKLLPVSEHMFYVTKYVQDLYPIESWSFHWFQSPVDKLHAVPSEITNDQDTILISRNKDANDFKFSLRFVREGRFVLNQEGKPLTLKIDESSKEGSELHLFYLYENIDSLSISIPLHFVDRVLNFDGKKGLNKTAALIRETLHRKRGYDILYYPPNMNLLSADKTQVIHVSHGMWNILMKLKFGDKCIPRNPVLGVITKENIEEGLRNNKERLGNLFYPGAKNIKKVHENKNASGIYTKIHDDFHALLCSKLNAAQFLEPLFKLVDSMRKRTGCQWSKEIWRMVDMLYFIDEEFIKDESYKTSLFCEKILDADSLKKTSDIDADFQKFVFFLDLLENEKEWNELGIRSDSLPDNFKKLYFSLKSIYPEIKNDTLSVQCMKYYASIKVKESTELSRVNLFFENNKNKLKISPDKGKRNFLHIFFGNQPSRRSDLLEMALEDISDSNKITQ